ncbi:MAG: VOC family protein, partial [Terriglobales bacterium]
MENPLKLKRIHHIEFFVGNARQAAFFYRKAFGFSQVAYSGLETGNRKRTSYAMSQGKANFVLTTPMTADDAAAEHIRKHGDGVRDIALEVADADEAFAEAVRRGATAAEEPHDLDDECGSVRRAAVHTYGDTIHSLISYKDYKGPFLPGFAADPVEGDDCGILRVDHIVGNVELGQMQTWADYYTRVFGFHRYITFDD